MTQRRRKQTNRRRDNYNRRRRTKKTHKKRGGSQNTLVRQNSPPDDDPDRFLQKLTKGLEEKDLHITSEEIKNSQDAAEISAEKKAPRKTTPLLKPDFLVRIKEYYDLEFVKASMAYQTQRNVQLLAFYSSTRRTDVSDFIEWGNSNIEEYTMGQVWNDIFEEMMPKRVSFVESFDTFLADDFMNVVVGRQFVGFDSNYFISEEVDIYDFEIDFEIDVDIDTISQMTAIEREKNSKSPMGQLLSYRQERGFRDLTYPLFDNNPLIPPLIPLSPLRENLQRVIFGPYFNTKTELGEDSEYEGAGVGRENGYVASTTLRPKGLRRLYKYLINSRNPGKIRKARLFIDLVHTLVVEDMLKKIPGSGTSTDQRDLINTFCELAKQSYDECYAKACEMVENK